MARTDLDSLAFRFSKAAQDIGPAAQRGLELSSLYLVGYIKREKLSGDPIHRRSGNLSSHIMYELQRTEDGGTSKIGVLRGVPYARWLEEGSDPHFIKPKMGMVDWSTDHGSGRARALRFVIGGKTIFAASVRHPGTKAYRFLRSSLQENRDKIKGIFRSVGASVLTGKEQVSET